MQIRVLGCYGGEALDFRTSCFLINQSVLIDAGSITAGLSLKEQPKVDHILLSHAHLDHIQDIGFLADNIFGKRDQPVRIWATKQTLGFIKDHILNNQIWPDFTALPTKDDPVLTYETVTPGKEFSVNGLRVKAVEVDHTIPTVGYLISDDKSSMVYSADTGSTKKLWSEAAKLKNLAAVFIEASFPNELKSLAETTGHLTPGDITEQVGKIKSNNFKTYVFHMKPGYLDVLSRQIDQLGNGVKMLKQGDKIKL